MKKKQKQLLNGLRLTAGVMCIAAIFLTTPINPWFSILYFGIGGGGIVLILDGLNKSLK